ncbi:HDOD domain-containing protein [Fundidesulfovibrio soli]|uniref:HDOD domain-containing protein n=1 Tax=Fundidesulfovibrio soli TaxID=2922716 RepID=UPI001FAFFC3F|nr:HDOD domain-containing protein [Fundidesulfovibrio soli]
MWVSELRPGLTLTRPVHDVNGRLLMGEGTLLTERFISVLKAWGVAEVAVRGEELSCAVTGGGEDLQQEDDPGNAALAREIVSLRLANDPAPHPFLADVHRLAVTRLEARLNRGDSFHVPPGVTPLPLQGPPAQNPLDPKALAESNPVIGAMPEVLAQLAQVMDDPSAFPAELAEIIQGDPGLSARLLKVVNSPFYGFSQRIDTISRAVTIIGVQQLSALALGMAVMDLFKNVSHDCLDVRGFWRHCLATACGARALASAVGLPNTERYFVGGLLHDVGLLLLLLREPRRECSALELARGQGWTLCAAERHILGLDHAKAGAALLKVWKLPPGLVQAAGYHHEPLRCPDVREAAIVHTADFLAEALVFGSGGQTVLMPFSTEAFASLAAPSGVACTVFDRVESQLDHLERVFMSHGPH